jgi:hypothetical protein
MAKKKRAVPAVSHTPRSARKWLDYSDIGMAALLVCAVLLAYAPAFNGALLWDDDSHLTKLDLQSFHGLWRIWFGHRRNATSITHCCTARSGSNTASVGDAVFGYHSDKRRSARVVGTALSCSSCGGLVFRGAWLAGFHFCAASDLRGSRSVDLGTEKHAVRRSFI